MKRFVLFFFLVFFLSSQSLLAKSVKELEGEFNELKTINLVQSQNLARALNQIQEIVDEFQNIRGQLGGHEFFINQFKNTTEEQSRRIEILENKLTMLTTQLEEIKAVGLLPTEQVKNFEDFQMIEKGLTMINVEEFEKANLYFEDFLKKNPKSRYKDIALYWNAETFFARAEYAKAIAEYQKIIEKFPKSTKIPPSLLKQGLSFLNRQSLPEAKAFLSKLIKDFPNSEEAITAKAKIKEIKRLLEQKEKEALINQIS